MELVQEFFNNLSFPIWSTYLGLVVGIVGTLATIYALFKSKKIKEPFCVVSTRNIIGSIMHDVPNLDIIYDGRLVDSLSVTTIYFWNAGSETINGIDIPENTPFEIKSKNHTVIYNVETKFIKRKANGFNFLVSDKKNKVNINFDFFDKNDGFVLDIVHSGNSAKELEVNAIFKGALPLVKRATFSHQDLPKPIQELLTGELRLPLSFILLVIPPFLSLDLLFNITGINHDYKIQMDILTAVLLIGSSWFFSYKLFKTRVPKGFSLINK